MNKKILLLGLYSMELVECGGTMLTNSLKGGESAAYILFADEEMKKECRHAAEILRTSVDFGDFNSATIDLSLENKKKIIHVLRKEKPDILITQDPEHSFTDFDPGRRIAMLNILESIALASRTLYIDKSALNPCNIPTIYYMTPKNPNCLVDIGKVWEQKQSAMNSMTKQLEFSGEYYSQYHDMQALEQLYSGYQNINDPYEKGKVIKQELDKAYHLYQAAHGHSHYLFSECFRREGLFHMQELTI